MLITATLALLLVPVAAVAQGGSSWPTADGVGQSGWQPGAQGPRSPGLLWLAGSDDLGGWTVSGRTAGTAGNLGQLVLSSTGDLLVTATRTLGDDERQSGVLALDAATGSLVWERTDLDDACKPAVAADGAIWVVQDLGVEGARQPGDHPEATAALVALDAADGSLLEDRRYTGVEVPLRPASVPCGQAGLQLASDGAIVQIDDTGFDATLRVVEPGDGEERWVAVLERSCALSPWAFTPPSGADNADRIYAAVTGRDDCRWQGPTIVGFDLGSGEVAGALALSGERFLGHEAVATLGDGTLVASTGGISGNAPAFLARVRGGLSVQGADQPAFAWELEMDPTQDVNTAPCADQLCGRVLAVAATDDQLVLREGNRLAAVAVADGAFRWREQRGMTPPVVVDGAGTIFTGRLSGSDGPRIAVVSADGEELATLDATDGLASVRALGPIADDGTLFGRDGNGTWFAVTDDPPPLAACIGVAVPSAGFLDVTPGNVHARNVDCVVFYELAQGVSADRYAPAASVSRQQMATFIARLVDRSDRPLPAGTPAFGDVSGVHADNIDRLAAAGIVQGTGPGRFDPTSPVRRDQMASFLVRAYEYIVEEEVAPAQAPFTDIAGNVHETNIRKVTELGFTTGLTATTYAPFNDVRRDQMASFLARSLERLVVEDERIEPRS